MKKVATCLFALTSVLFADTGLFEKENDAIRCCNFTPAPYPGDPLCNACGMYPAYAGVGLNCGWDVYAVGELLYWQPHRQAVVLASENVPTVPLTQIELVENYDYRPGFRVGLGMVLPCFAHWILNADYTWYHHGFTNHFSAALPNTLSNRLGTTLTSTYASINAKSHFNYDFVNANLQTTFYLGKQVIINPYFGLKWMGREVTVSESLLRSTGVGTDFQNSNQKKEGIGPDVGANLTWLWAWGFSFVTKADVAILYSYKASYDQFSSSFVLNAAPTIRKQRMKTASMEFLGKGGLGLGWGSYLACDRFHLNFAATYDVVAEITTLFTPTEAGILQGQYYWFNGLTVTGQFDF